MCLTPNFCSSSSLFLLLQRTGSSAGKMETWAGETYGVGDPGDESRKPKAESGSCTDEARSRKPEAERRKPKAASRRPKAESRKPKAEYRKPNTEAMCEVCTKAVILRSTLNTSYITGLDMCKVCTEAVHSIALWTRVTSQVWTCVKYVPKQSIA